MPPVPGAHLVLIHADFALPAFETRFNAGTRFDHPRQLVQRRLLKWRRRHTRRRKVVMIAMVLVLIGGIARGTGLQGPLVCQGTTGDHEPLLGAGPFALNPCLHPAFDYLAGHGTFLAVSRREPPPGRRMEGCAPIRDRLPWGFRSPSTAGVLRPWHLQVAHHGSAGHPQQIPLAPLAQRMAKLRVATELIIAGDPAMRHLLTPRVEHL